MVGIEKHTINVPEAKLQKLKQKLELADLPEHEIEGAGWKYGVPAYIHLPPFPQSKSLY